MNKFVIATVACFVAAPSFAAITAFDPHKESFGKLGGVDVLKENPIVLYDGPPSPSALAPVPEPATWAMLVAGFGFAGFALRRRRQTIARTSV